MTWQIMADRGDMVQALSGIFAYWHRRCFAASPIVHPEMPVEIRHLQQEQDWCMAYLLTPIALYRLAIPLKAPDLPLPEGWSAAAWAEQPCVGLGPALNLKIPGVLGQGHLQYLPEIGHFLWQPLVQNLRRYTDADAVFAAWEGVLDYRNKIRGKTRGKTRASMREQQQCDRRAFLRGLRAPPAGTSGGG